MKKMIALAVMLLSVLTLCGCGINDTYTIHVTVPAGTEKQFVYIEDFIYSDEEISPKKNQLTLKSIDVPDRTEVVLMPIEVKEENAYERTYFTKGEPMIIEVEKGAWFKIGIAMNNSTDEDIVVGITVENVKIRMK